jgi:hypothetical protein
MCKGVTRIHKFTSMPNMSARETLTLMICEVLMTVTVVSLVTWCVVRCFRKISKNDY